MKKLVISAFVVLVAAGAIWHWYPHTRASAAPARPGSATSSGNVGTFDVATPVPSPPQHVRKLASADERRELLSHIAAAQRARKDARAPHHSSLGATAASDGGSGDEGDMDKDVIRGAMHEVLPFLADCYTDARATTLSADHLEIRAHFTLTGDPDVGTVIDANQLFDSDKHPLPSKLDDCIRSTLQTLELPPLGDGDTVEVDYPLAFSDRPPDGSDTRAP